MPKYLIKLLRYSLLIGSIPVICIGLIIAYYFYKDYQADSNQMRAELLQQNQSRVEQMMRTLELSVSQFANASFVKQSVFTDIQPQDFVLIQELWSSLYSLQTFVDIHKSYLVNLEHDWVIESGRVVKFSKLSQYPEEKDKFLGYAANKEAMNWTTADEQPESPFIQMVAKLPLIDSGGPAREILVIQIEKSQIMNLLSKSHAERQYILDGKGNVFLESSAGDSMGLLTDKELTASLQSRLSSSSQGYFPADTAYGRGSIYYNKSPKYEWTYVSFTPVAEIYNRLIPLFVMGLVILAGIFLVVVLLAFYGSRRMYSPVGKLFNLTQSLSGQDQDSSPDDEFHQIEDQVTKLLSSKQELQQQVRGQFDQLKEFWLIKLLTGPISSEEFRTRVEAYGVPVNWKQLGVLVLQIDTLDGTQYAECDRDLLMFAINNIVNDSLPPGQGFGPVLMDFRSQVTVLSCPYDGAVEAKAFLFETATLLRKQVKAHLALPVSIGISRPFADYGGAAGAYHQGLEALAFRIHLGNELIMSYEDIDLNRHLNKEIYKLLQGVEEQLLLAVKASDKQQTDQLFDHYIRLLQKEAYNKEFSFLLLQLVSKILQVLQEHGGTVKGVLGEAFALENFISFRTLDEVTGYFKLYFFPRVFTFLLEQGELLNRGMAEKMLGLIHERYDQDISLEICASLLNYNPTYMSRVFKKHYGLPYMDYVIEYRMRMAKSLLENTTMNVADIARKLQYMHTSAFIRTFRKIVGVTPGKYRQDLQNAGLNEEVQG